MESTSYMPHAYCLLWQPLLMGIHIIADFAIFAAYTIISALLYQTKRSAKIFGLMRDLFQKGAPGFDITAAMGEWSFAAFGTFIFACGLTHLMDIIVLWVPLYWLQALLKVITALASVSTAVILASLISSYVRALRVNEQTGS